jgi:hypothetical protein
LHLHAHGWRRPQQDLNPLMPLFTQAFQNYRKKQKGKPDSDQKWPDVLEAPFLDGTWQTSVTRGHGTRMASSVWLTLRALRF